MIHARRDPQRAQRADPAHAQYQLLANPRALVTAVQPRCQLPVLRVVALHVAVQQVQADTPHLHQPDLRQQRPRTRRNADRDRITIRRQRMLHRQVGHLRVEVLLALVSRHVQVLLEIPLVIEQPDRHQRHTQPAGTLDVIARQDPQTTRINGNRLVNPELGGKIGHRSRSQDPRVRRGPSRDRRHVLLQPPKSMVDAAEQHHLRGP